MKSSNTFSGILYLVYSIILFFGHLSGVNAQPQAVPLKTYGIAEGLPEEAITGLVQDNQGYIWCTTQNGLVRYDGYEFKVFGDHRSSSDDDLFFQHLQGGIIKGKDGKLWIGGMHDGGIAAYDPKNGKFVNYLPNPEDSTKIPYNNSFVIFEDLESNIWFGNNSDALDSTILCRLDQKTQIVHSYPFFVLRRFNDIVKNWQLAQSPSDSSIWFLEQKGRLNTYNREKDAFETVFEIGEKWSGTNLMDTAFDLTLSGRKSAILLLTNDHVLLWDPISKNVTKSYNHNPALKREINGGAAFEDFYGNYWVCANEFISRIDPKSETIDHMQYGLGKLAFLNAPEVITASYPIYQDDKEIWFQLVNGGRELTNFLIYQHDTGDIRWYDSKFNDPKNNFQSFNRYPVQMIRDQSGLPWIGTRPYLHKSDPKRNLIELVGSNLVDPNIFSFDRISSIMEDSKQRLWIATDHGLGLIGPEQSYFVAFKKDPVVSGSISDNDVFRVFEDKDHQIWIATKNGLNLFNEETQSFTHFFKNYNGISVILSISQDSKGRIWVSIINEGVYIIDKNGKILKLFSPSQSELNKLASNRIFTIFHDSEGDTWLGDRFDNEYGLFRYRESINGMKHFHNDRGDNTSLSSNEIHFVTEDKNGQLWVGTDGGLNKFDRNTETFIRYPFNNNLISISGAYADEDGSMWFGTYLGGLAHTSYDSEEVTIYNENDGLLHNDLIMSGVAADNEGKLYLGTSRGLSVFDTRSKTFKNYFERDGFQPYSRGYTAIKRRNGEIWMGGNKGLNRIQPEKLEYKDPTPPKVWITSMTIQDSLYTRADSDLFQNAVAYTDEVNLAYFQKDVSFEFVALHYLRSEDNRYSWKLENYDKDWSAPSLERKAYYTNLSPGTYRFHVKASNTDGIWNETGATIKLIIAPPYWLSLWAYVSYFFIVAAIGLAVHRIQKGRVVRMEREKAREKELMQAKEIEKAYTELKETQNQLIYSEKMASLGELTAGIAHEIQNPLNFVNNFSDINTELAEEMREEIAQGHLESALEILADIVENEKKITHHGKRAEDIVKSMLQHSRGNTGEKQPTDINALADEYLRLAYHGMRAKDKSFNVTLNTEFDQNLAEINVVPQDIGRVVLNIITNAFHALADQKKVSEKEFKPTLTVTTKQQAGKTTIIIKDNGTGIPEAIHKKIFQPFFSTKAAGHGTGLGLSLSYDIITKGHNGSLEVESTPGQGTAFIIKIPSKA